MHSGDALCTQLPRGLLMWTFLSVLLTVVLSQKSPGCLYSYVVVNNLPPLLGTYDRSPIT